MVPKTGQSIRGEIMKKSFNKSVLQVFDHIEEGIHIIDKKGIIFYYNQYASKIDGIDRDRAINRHLLEVYPSLSHDSSTLLRVLASGQPIIREEQTFYNYKGEKITTTEAYQQTYSPRFPR